MPWKEKCMKKLNGVILTILLVLVGCGKKTEEKIAEKIIEKSIGGKADVDIAKGTMNIETEDGNMSVQTGKSAKIPDKFPTDIFVFKPSDVLMAMELPKGYTISLKTGKDVAAVTSAYKKSMTDKGWKQKAAMDLDGKSMFFYEKEKRVTHVAISHKDGETNIVLTASTNPN